jgi:hypothetical protein
MISFCCCSAAGSNITMTAEFLKPILILRAKMLMILRKINIPLAIYRKNLILASVQSTDFQLNLKMILTR